ncbi:hypothetical protein TNCV_1532481 [Trichonephila clavipes]|nr:hypothetical protein TNCV_1532481 [Trichonephila clavipes]
MQRNCALRIAGRGRLTSFSVEYKTGNQSLFECEVKVVVDPIAGLAINHRRDNQYESDKLKFPTRRLTLSKPSDFVNNIQGHYNFLLPHQGLRYVFDMGRRIS